MPLRKDLHSWTWKVRDQGHKLKPSSDTKRLLTQKWKVIEALNLVRTFSRVRVIGDATFKSNVKCQDAQSQVFPVRLFVPSKLITQKWNNSQSTNLKHKLFIADVISSSILWWKISRSLDIKPRHRIRDNLIDEWSVNSIGMINLSNWEKKNAK